MLKNIVKIIGSIFCFLILQIPDLFAQEVLPRGCVALVIKNDIVSISKDKNKFLFIHNLSEDNIWLVSQIENNNLQSVLSSKMDAGSWSALILNQEPKDIKFSCIESKPGHEQKISCQEALAICQWPNTKIPEDRKGVFFVAENMDLSSLTAYSERNGYSLS
jgi:hypothetical protein